MWHASPDPQFNEFAPCKESSACLHQNSQFGFLQSWLNLVNPFAPFGISVLGIDILLGVNQSLVNIFQTVRFLAK